MKLALILFSLLSLSFWFGAQGTPPVECRGKRLPITAYEVGLKMTGPSMPLRFGGGGPFPHFGLRRDKALRLVIRNQEQYKEFWKQLTSRIQPGDWAPPTPEIDFSKEMLIVSTMGPRPSSGFSTVIDGACEANGQVEIFITNVEDVRC